MVITLLQWIKIRVPQLYKVFNMLIIIFIIKISMRVLIHHTDMTVIYMTLCDDLTTLIIRISEVTISMQQVSSHIQVQMWCTASIHCFFVVVLFNALITDQTETKYQANIHIYMKTRWERHYYDFINVLNILGTRFNYHFIHIIKILEAEFD